MMWGQKLIFSPNDLYPVHHWKCMVSIFKERNQWVVMNLFGQGNSSKESYFSRIKPNAGLQSTFIANDLTSLFFYDYVAIPIAYSFFSNSNWHFKSIKLSPDFTRISCWELEALNRHYLCVTCLSCSFY